MSKFTEELSLALLIDPSTLLDSKTPPPCGLSNGRQICTMIPSVSEVQDDSSTTVRSWWTSRPQWWPRNSRMPVRAWGYTEGLQSERSFLTDKPQYKDQKLETNKSHKSLGCYGRDIREGVEENMVMHDQICLAGPSAGVSKEYDMA